MTGFQTLGIIGAGAWGTALAQTAARAGRDVYLLARQEALAKALQTERINRRYLPDIDLHPAISAGSDSHLLANCHLILVVTPAQAMRETLERLKPFIKAPLILCSKGVELGSHKLLSEVAKEILQDISPAILSGPSFASEVAKGLPTALTLACEDQALGKAMTKALATPVFRPYQSLDIIGAQVGGAVKNVLAIACGMVMGLELGQNAKAALLARGFAEMTRLAVALGGQRDTLSGLSGLGDLVLTASSSQSRNMSLGLALGQGQALQEILQNRHTIAEGVPTAKAISHLAKDIFVDMPITDAVAKLLEGKLSLQESVENLLARPLKAEF